MRASESLFVLGYIQLSGWEGRLADICYSNELIRRSAMAGQFAGLVGFPNYVKMGYFKNCRGYPIIDNAQIRGFLDGAEKRDNGYYKRILIEELEADSPRHPMFIS